MKTVKPIAEFVIFISVCLGMILIGLIRWSFLEPDINKILFGILVLAFVSSVTIAGILVVRDKKFR